MTIRISASGLIWRMKNRSRKRHLQKLIEKISYRNKMHLKKCTFFVFGKFEHIRWGWRLEIGENVSAIFLCTGLLNFVFENSTKPTIISKSVVIMKCQFCLRTQNWHNHEMSNWQSHQPLLLKFKSILYYPCIILFHMLMCFAHNSIHVMWRCVRGRMWSSLVFFLSLKFLMIEWRI